MSPEDPKDHDPSQDRQIEEWLRALTLEEKVSLVSGSGLWHTTPVTRLGIPAIKVTDGPNGARGDGESGATAACFPAGCALGATWDEELVREIGAALGDETRSKGAQVLLGPTINLHRTPLGGRNFESYSEDPFLTGKIATAFVHGVQSRGVGACLKHFVCNDSEFERHTISSEVGERALRELYLLPFEMAVKAADPWAVMSAYNRVNGVFASSHRELLTDVLKGEWGFRGFVVSDWGASQETAENANGGLDLEMPGPARTMGEHLLAALQGGEVEEKTLDDKVRRLLFAVVRSGIQGTPNETRDEAKERSENRPEHRALARRVAAESMVLLKNESILPFDAAKISRLAVIGPNAEIGQIHGGGSASVEPHYRVHPLAALRDRLGESVQILHEPGCSIHKLAPPFDPSQLETPSGERGFQLERFDDPDFAAVSTTVCERRSEWMWFGAGLSASAAPPASARLTASFTPASSGTYTFGLASAGLSRLYLDGELVIDNWTTQRSGTTFFSTGTVEERCEVELEAGRSAQLRIDFQLKEEAFLAGVRIGVLPPLPEDAIECAVRAARDADAAIVVVGTTGEWESEGHDRTELALPGEQAELIRAVCRANPRTAIVINTGSPIDLEWLGDVPAALQAWFPGQEFGNALVDVLFGDANPCGKLPTTFPVRLEDTPAFTSYPGENGRVLYGEGIFAGYRWYDTRDIAPALPFGHGLSYTEFEYGPLTVEAAGSAASDTPRGTVRIAFDITNVGERAGKEVPQLYVRDIVSSLARPMQELKAFRKVELAPGETAKVFLDLDARAFSYWDPKSSKWVDEAGEFEIAVGASSRDIRRTITIRR